MAFNLKATINITAIITAAALISGCTDVDKKNKGLLRSAGLATVVVNIGLPGTHSSNLSLPDRILRFFSTEVYAQTAPSYLTGVRVRVTAPDFGVLEQSFVPGAQIMMMIPQGDSRLIEVLADTPSVTFRGSIIANLKATQVSTVTITMALSETKIIVINNPPSSANKNIVQINSISGDGYIERNGVQIGYGPATFRPYDIEYDKWGRIYIATNGGTTGECRIFRINSINDTTGQGIIDNGINGIVSLAIDSSSNYIYYASVSQLYRCNLDGTSIKNDYIMTGINNIRAIAIDNSGALYIVGGATPPYFLKKYNTAGNGSTISTVTANLTMPRDVIIKNNFAYVANEEGASNYKILQYDSNLNLINHFGTINNSTTRVSMNQFKGPWRFVAVLNRKFYLIDDYDMDGTGSNPDGTYDGLISFDDMYGSNWQTLYPADNGNNPFYFFYDC